MRKIASVLSAAVLALTLCACSSGSSTSSITVAGSTTCLPIAEIAAEGFKEETGIDAVVTDLVAVTSSSRVITYANGDNTMYMDHSFLCALKPGGNAEPYVGDEESLNVGWFELDDLPEPLAASTVERLKLFRRYLDNKRRGDAHAMFVADGVQR